MLPALPDANSMHKKLRYRLIFSRYTFNKRILQSDWTSGTPGYIQPKVVVSDATFPWWLSPCKWNKLSFDSFLRYWSKNPAIWFDKKHNWPHPMKSSSLRCYLHLRTNSMQNNTSDITWFFQEILIIKESCTLTGREAHLATPYQN